MCKLDMYRYTISRELGVIIDMDGPRDPDIGDIVTEVNGYNGKCYVNGLYFIAGDLIVKQTQSGTQLIIRVERILEDKNV